MDLNWDKLAGQWKQFVGEARNQWGKLTDDHWEEIAGHRDRLIGKIQEVYGITKEEASKQVEEWAGRLKK